MTTDTPIRRRGTRLALAAAVAGLSLLAASGSAGAEPPPATVSCVSSVPRQYLPHYYPSGYSYSERAWGEDASPDEPAL